MQEASKVWKTSDADDYKRERINSALRKSSIVSEDAYAQAIFASVIIVRDWTENKWYAIEYTMKGDTVTFGESQEVEQAYIPKTVQEAVEKQRKQLIEKRNKNRVELSEGFTAHITESEDGGFYLKGMFAEADVKNSNDRMYPKGVLETAIKGFKENIVTGLDGHPPINVAGSYRDIALKFESAWMEGKRAFCKVKVLDTSAGKDLKVVASENIPVGLSMRGYGEEKFDKELGANVVQDNYELAGIDAVLEPAFEQAKVIREQKEKIANIGGKDMDELKKMIEELSKSFATLTEKVTTLESKEADGLSEADKLLLTETRVQVEKDKAILEAKKRVVEILKEKEEELKDCKFTDVLQKHLENCETKEDVDRQYPLILETLKTFEGATTKPTDQHSIILADRISKMDEKGFWGAMKQPNTVEEAWRGILDKFENKPYGHKMDNPRWIAKTILESYLKLYIGGGYQNEDFDVSDVESRELMRESMQNPLYRLTQRCDKRIHETLGDTEAYTGDIAASAAFVLPLFTYVMKDLMEIVNGVCAIQPLDRPTGEAWFLKEYYEDGSGTGTEVGANFDKAEAVVAEAGTPKQMRIGLAKTAIALKDALAIYAPFTIELEQDLMATKGMSIDSVHIQMMRGEIFREISHQILYHMINTAALADGDGETLIATDTFHTTPDVAGGWTAGEWLTKGLTRAVKQTGAKMDVVPYQVVPDFIIAGSALSYLFTEKNFVADDSAKRPSNFGFRKVGTFQNEYALYLTSMSDFDDLILLGHRGTSFAEAAEIFLPYILFWLGPRIPTTTAKASRTCKSRFAIEKSSGRKLATIAIEP